MTPLEILFCILCPLLLVAAFAFYCTARVWRQLAEHYEAKAVNRYRRGRADLTPCIRRAGRRNAERTHDDAMREAGLL